LSEAGASISVPSTLKCSFDSRFGSPSLLQYPGKELVCHPAFKQSIPVLREGRVMPDTVVHKEFLQEAGILEQEPVNRD